MFDREAQFVITINGRSAGSQRYGTRPEADASVLGRKPKRWRSDGRFYGAYLADFIFNVFFEHALPAGHRFLHHIA